VSTSPAESADPHGLTPFVEAILDGFAEGLILFDRTGRMAYANQRGRDVLDRLGRWEGRPSDELIARMSRFRLRVHDIQLSPRRSYRAVFLVPEGELVSLAEQERRAILDAVRGTGWRLAAAARALGISRTTLWRRLRRYGLRRVEYAAAGQRSESRST